MKINNQRSYELSLYGKEKVLTAANVYKSFCSINVEQHNQKLVCTFGSNIVPVERVMNEFDNYLIELMQSNVSTNY